MDFFQRIGNLFSGKGFTNNDEANKNAEAARRRKEEEERRKAEAARLAAEKAASQPKTVTPVTPRGVIDPTGLLTIPGSQPRNANPATGNGLLMPRPVSTPAKPAAKPAQPEDNRPFLEKLGAGLQQAGGRVGDTFLQAGGLVNYGVTGLASIGKSEEERDRMFAEAAEMNENARTKLINGQRDISGNMIVGNRDIDEAATRVAMGKGNLQDFASVGGRGLDVASTSTMFINPARTLSGAALNTGKLTAAQAAAKIAPFVGKEALLYGGLEGTTGSLEKYGETGDLAEAAKAFLPNAAAGAAGQIGLEGLAFAGGRAINGVSGRVGSAQRVIENAEATVGEANQNVTRMNDVVRQAEERVAQVPDAVEVQPGTGIKSPNQAQGIKTVAQAQVDAARQAALEAQQLRAAAEAEANQAAEAARRIMNEQPLPQAPEAPVLPMKPRGVADETKMAARQAEADIKAQAEAESQAPAPIANEVVEAPSVTAAKEAPTPVAPVTKSADVAYENKAVQAAQERVDYLKREFADPADIKAAEAELRALKNEAKVTKTEGKYDKEIAKQEEYAAAADEYIAHAQKAVDEEKALLAKGGLKTSTTLKAAEDKLAEAIEMKSTFTKKAESIKKLNTPVEKDAKVAKADEPAKSPAKTEEPIATHRADAIIEGKLANTKKKESVEAEIPTAVELTKTGRVKAAWLKKEIDRIQSSDATPEIKKQAMQDLDRAVKDAEAKFAGTKKAESDAGDIGLTAKQKRARKTVAEADAEIKAKSKAKNKTVRENAKAEGDKIAPRKDKAGGKVTGYMAREARLRGDPDARAALDNASPKTVQSHEKTYNEAINTVSKMSSREVIDRANKLDVKDFDYKKSAEALAYSGRLADEVARLATKKRLTKAEKAELQSVREAQTDLYEKIAQSESDAARSVSYLGYLYKQLDPGMVTKKLVDNLKKEAGDQTLKITAKDEAQMLSRNKTLQKEFNENTDLLNQLETLQKSKNASDAAKAAKIAAKLEKSNARLDDAFKSVNDLTFEIRQRNMDEGIIKKEEWYGRNLDTYQRASMLSAPSGRLRDIVTTNVFTTGDVVAKAIVESLLGRAFNGLTGKHTIDTKVFGNRDSWKAGVKEFKQKTAEDWRGESRAPRFLTGLKKGGATMDQRSGITSAYGPSGQRKSLPLRYIHTSVALPTNISQIYKKNALFSAGYDEGIRRGWSKKEATELGKSYMVNAPKEVYDKINYNTKEISGLQSKLGEKINNKFLDWERQINTSGMSNAQKKAAANALTLGKNLTIPFVSYPLGTLKNLATRQSMLVQTGKMIGAIRRVQKGDEGAIKDVVSHAAQAGTNGAKLAAAALVLAPFISDTDASGKGYTPPYLRIPTIGGGEDNDIYVPIGSLGPVGGQLINLWALKHMQKDMAEGDIPGAILGYGVNLTKGIANATGLANLATASSPLFNFANTAVGWQSDPDNASESGLKLATDLASDVATQFIPSALRDVNSFLDPATGGVRPETRVLKEDGSRDNVKSMLARIGSGVPIVSQSLPDDDEGAKAPNFAERVIGGTAASAQQQEGMKQERENVAKYNKSLQGVLSDNKYRDLLDKDNQKLYDKALKGELTSKELEQVRNQFTADDTIKKFREDGDWDGYGVSQQLKREKLNNNPKTPKSDVEKLDREIGRIQVLKDNKVTGEEYNFYKTVSQSELKRMFDPEETDLYNPELANRLMDIDEAMAAKKLADEGDRSGINPWERAKYSLEAVRKSLGGGGGKGNKGIATEVGTVKGSSLRTAEAPALKARNLRQFEYSVPNLAAQTARTNLKKQISVQKGVKL